MNNRVFSFDIDKGTDWYVEANYKDSDCLPVNLTGATFTGQIRNLSGTLLTTFDISEIDLSAGHFRIGLTNTKTSLLVDGNNNKYDIEMTLSGLKTRIVEGLINARSEVTS